MIRIGAALICGLVVASAYAHAVRRTAQDGPIAWAIRHPVVMFELMTDPPPPPNAPMAQGAAWLFLHANEAATLFADPPPKGGA
jgi:hypothetical protein